MHKISSCNSTETINLKQCKYSISKENMKKTKKLDCETYNLSLSICKK